MRSTGAVARLACSRDSSSFALWRTKEAAFANAFGVASGRSREELVDT